MEMGIDEPGNHQSASRVNGGIDLTAISFSDKDDFIVPENDLTGILDAVAISVPGNKRSILNQSIHVASSF
jgi:hypothetical protein